MQYNYLKVRLCEPNSFIIKKVIALSKIIIIVLITKLPLFNVTLKNIRKIIAVGKCNRFGTNIFDSPAKGKNLTLDRNVNC